MKLANQDQPIALQLPAVFDNAYYDSGRPPLRGKWVGECALDPITGLIAFPSFYDAFRQMMPSLLCSAAGVGIAIGDVDDLKSYVEARRSDPSMFGHLAGNSFMAALGSLARDRFALVDAPWACMATFGGDEIIFACATVSRSALDRTVRRIAVDCAATLPRTVSFATGWFVSGDPVTDAISCGVSLPTAALALVDRALFRAKVRGKRAAGRSGPVIASLRERQSDGGAWRVVTRPSREAADGSRREAVALTGSVHRIGRDHFFKAPADVLGERRSAILRVTLGARRFKTHAFRLGQYAACLIPAAEVERLGLKPGSMVSLEVSTRDNAPAMRVPTDLAKALAAVGVELERLPAHYRRQLLFMVGEASTPQVRIDRIGMVVEACMNAQQP